MTLVLVAKRGSEQARGVAREIKSKLTHCQVLAEGTLAQDLGWPVPPSADELAQQADLLVVLGGDGTLIHGARLLRGRPVPVLGVNLGGMGFLTEVTLPELFPMLEQVLAGRYKAETRMKLSCRLLRGQQVVIEDEVLNDVVINKGALARIADHEVAIDGKYVTTYKSDGVIIATPTGSTAYALSAGGPIVHPSLDCALIAPICPHALTQRPIVVPATCALTVRLKSEVADVFLTIDGQTGHALESGDRLEVCRSPHSVLLIRNPKVDYYEVLRQKLHWGER